MVGLSAGLQLCRSRVWQRSTVTTIQRHLPGLSARVGVSVPFCTTSNPTSSVVNSINPPQQVVQFPSFKDLTIEQHWDEFCTQKQPCLSTALLQVFSVSIHPDFDNGMETPCGIYGSIRAIDKLQTVVNLYDRGHADPETVLKDGNLSLIGDDGSFILGHALLDVHLKDKARDIEVAKGQCLLHPADEDFGDSCDKLMEAQVPGQHGWFVSMYYTIFQFAVVATVTIKISKIRDTTAPSTDLYGSILAGYPNAKKYCATDDETKLMKTSLFHKPEGQFVQAMLETPIMLSRCVVAVPAYSSLRVEAQLWDSHGQFACGSVDFPARDDGQLAKWIDGEGGSVYVKVSWQDAYSRLYVEDEILTDSDEEDDQEAINSEDSSHRRQSAHLSPQIVSGRQPGAAFSPVRGLHSAARMTRRMDTELLEVFSVFVDGNTCDVSTICGRIVVNNLPHVNIYEKDLSNPEFLSEHKSLVSVEGHLALDNCYHMYLDLFLKDPVQGLGICDGSLAVDDRRLLQRIFYNIRLCSVIQGPDGYAAVHYTMFGYACRASVEISVFFSDPATVPANIYGCVFARYGDCSYPNSYIKKYYQSRLFDMPQTEPVQLTTNSKIPLLKSVVAVPLDSSVIVEADLRVMRKGNEKDELVSGTFEFEVDFSDIVRKEFREEHYRIEVAVKFSRGR